MLDIIVSSVVSWVFGKVADRTTNEFGRLRPSRSEPILYPTDRPFTSRFATTAEDLDAVLELRRRYFGRGVIVPDESYRACWRRDHDSMRLVHDDTGKPVGYWSVVPVGRDAFKRFVRGRGSHRDVLERDAIAWSEVDPAAAYLYIVGAVVPIGGGRADREGSLLQKLVSGRVVLDAYQVAVELMSRLTLRGICGYPSRTGGRDTLERMGFVRTRVHIDGDDQQPIYLLSAGRPLQSCRAYLDGYLRRHAGEVPAWDEADRLRFLERLGRRRRRRSSGPFDGV